MKRVGREKALIVSIVIVMIISSIATMFFFQVRTLNNEKEFVIGSDSSSTIGITDGTISGKFEVMQEETLNSSWMQCVIIIEFVSSHYYHNLSFSLETEYVLGSGRYSVNETKKMTLNTSMYTNQWESRRYSPEGALVTGHEFANSSILYSSPQDERQTLEIHWEYNLTSTLTPRDEFECIMSVCINDFTYSAGIGTIESLIVVFLVNVVGLLVIFEIYPRRTRNST
ncbi:MAG: hypothetical protein P1Q69_07085 [Candidatus Thorarchaeota archaeon]|nr:hypothetical protein [Candidatus Thorarchaeota archaeon]